MTITTGTQSCSNLRECEFKTYDGYCQLTWCPKTIETKAVTYQYGWVCPKCGAVYGPNVSSCWHCTEPMKITCEY